MFCAGGGGGGGGGTALVLALDGCAGGGGTALAFDGTLPRVLALGAVFIDAAPEAGPVIRAPSPCKSVISRPPSFIAPASESLVAARFTIESYTPPTDLVPVCAPPV